MQRGEVVVRCPQVDDKLEGDTHPILRRVLLNRGIGEPRQLQHRLQNLPDPSLLKDITPALQRLYQALLLQQAIVIVGDFDVDGATSTALMMRTLRGFGFENVRFVVPNRFEYGYGLSKAIVRDIANHNRPDVIITVDNGISSIAGVAEANNLGIDVIVTDHHLPGNELPKALAIINPNQQGCDFPAKNSAGVAVAFYLLLAFRKFLREQQYFTKAQIPEPNLAEYLDLVAIGTVCDLVPMDYYNQILAMQGMARIRSGKSLAGIQALLQVAGKEAAHVASVDIGFAIGPRLNAAGRLDDISQGIALLLTDSFDLALEFAQSLDDLNRDRKVIEQQMQQEALAIVDGLENDIDKPSLGLCLFHEDWHQGVVGLVASRLKDRFYRPVIAFAKADDGVSLKGSGRSIAGLHLRDLLDVIASQNPGLIDKFGGHAMAAGLSIEKTRLAQFQTAFNKALQQYQDSEIFNEHILVDGELKAQDLNLYSAQLLQYCLPWGQQLPEPKFMGTFNVLQTRCLKQQHLKFTLTSSQDASQQVDALCFFADEIYLKKEEFTELTLVYRLNINFFRGQQHLQLLIDAIVAYK